MLPLRNQFAFGLLCCFLVAAPTRSEEPAAKKADRTIRLAGGALTLVAPKSWEKKTPRFRIIQYEFSVPGPDKETPAARITIMGAGGSIDANIDRWKTQFSKVGTFKRKEAKIKGQTVTTVDLRGTYRDRPGGPFSGAPEKLRPDYRMLGVIIATKHRGQYFIKLIGPERTLAKQDEAIEAMLKTLTLKQN